MGIVGASEMSLMVYVLLIISPMASSISDGEALIELKNSFTDHKALTSWRPGTNPCAKGNEWLGLACSNGIITGLRLQNVGLSGTIDINALVQIPSLRSLSFMDNALSGPIPEFNRIKGLRAIYLSGNQFSGEIGSDFFTNIRSLRKLWLSNNNFTGKIPSSLGQLTNLMELHLENNQFSGEIPPMALPKLAFLDVSNNHLEGEIPSILSSFTADSFGGNPALCGAQLGKKCNQTEPPNKGNDANKNNYIKISFGLMVVVVLILVVICVLISVLRRRQESSKMYRKEKLDDDEVKVHVASTSKKSGELSRTGTRTGSSRRGSSNGKSMADLVVVNDVKGVFGLQDLMKAAAEVLGNGTLGSSYKATMSNKVSVVVKRTKEMNKLGRDGYDVEVRRLGNLRHPNVLTPLAYHFRREEKLLIHEYMAKGSLLHLLHSDHGPAHAELTWAVRLMIVKGIAKGLGYLHTELASYDLPHGNLKSCNVLLGPNHEPLLSDYGYFPLITPNQAAQMLFGYKSPEALESNTVSPKSDVYCLGILILEILTGKFPSQYLNNGKGGNDVVQWVKSAISEQREAELLDQQIANDANSIEEMKTLLHIGSACTESDPNKRLDIREAIRRIEEVQVEGDQKARTIQVLSLRDGYGDSLPPQPHVSFASNGEGQGSMRMRHTNAGELSGRHNTDNFAFDIS